MLISDTTVFQQLQEGNEQALSILYERYWKKLYDMGYTFTKSTEETEDLIHDLFLEIWQNRERIYLKKELSVYLYIAMRYKVYNWLSRKKVREQYLKETMWSASRQQESVEITLMAAEMVRLYDEAIDKLPGQCRLIFKMHKEQDKPAAEIASELGLSIHTVYTQLKRGNKAMKSLLTQNTLLLFILFHELK